MEVCMIGKAILLNNLENFIEIYLLSGNYCILKFIY
jgi:hypothetical protein